MAERFRARSDHLGAGPGAACHCECEGGCPAIVDCGRATADLTDLGNVTLASDQRPPKVSVDQRAKWLSTTLVREKERHTSHGVNRRKPIYVPEKNWGGASCVPSWLVPPCWAGFPALALPTAWRLRGDRQYATPSLSSRSCRSRLPLATTATSRRWGPGGATFRRPASNCRLSSPTRFRPSSCSGSSPKIPASLPCPSASTS